MLRTINKNLMCILCIIISFLFIACGSDNSKMSLTEIVINYSNCVNYNDSYYYSDGENIFVRKDEANSTKIAKGAYVFWVDENGIYYSDKIMSVFLY